MTFKPGHIRKTLKDCVFVDFETFRWGGLEPMDLFQLTSLPSKLPDVDRTTRIVAEAYCAGRNKIQRWPVVPQKVALWIQAVRERFSRRVPVVQLG